jgi:transposase InsO family protein
MEAHDEFCEDCINGKLSQALHTRPAAQAERPLCQVFSDVHGPVPVCSQQGHYYWVTFIDDYSHFPTVYFIAKKSDVFTAFQQYKTWAENATSQQISILHDDKGSEYMLTEFDKFLMDAGIS